MLLIYFYLDLILLFIILHQVPYNPNNEKNTVSILQWLLFRLLFIKDIPSKE